MAENSHNDNVQHINNTEDPFEQLFDSEEISSWGLGLDDADKIAAFEMHAGK